MTYVNHELRLLLLLKQCMVLYLGIESGVISELGKQFRISLARKINATNSLSLFENFRKINHERKKIQITEQLMHIESSELTD